MTKPIPPEYPRPVPYIDFEEDPILPGTTVYESKRTAAYLDPDEEAKQRAAKRNRIEAHAYAYLRGDAPLILTAGLAGPFSKGWSNPWSTRRNHVARRGALQTKSAVKKSQPQTQQPHQPPQQPEPRNTTTHGFVHPRAAFRADSNVSIKASSPFDSIAQTSRQQTPDAKVQAWLRTNDAYSSSKNVDPPSSPTSIRTPRARERRSSSKRQWTPTKQVFEPPSQLGRVPPQQSPRRDNIIRNAASFTQTQTSNRVETHGRLQDVLQQTISHEPEITHPADDHGTIPSEMQLGSDGGDLRRPTNNVTSLHPTSSNAKPGESSEEEKVLVKSSPPAEPQTFKQRAVPPSSTTPSQLRPTTGNVSNTVNGFVSSPPPPASKLIVREILTSARRTPRSTNPKGKKHDFQPPPVASLNSIAARERNQHRVSASTTSKGGVPPFSTAVTAASDAPSTQLPPSAQKPRIELRNEFSDASNEVSQLKELKNITRYNTSTSSFTPVVPPPLPEPPQQESTSLAVKSPPQQPLPISLNHSYSSNGSVKSAFRVTKRVSLAPIETPKPKSKRLKSPPPPPLSVQNPSDDIEMQDPSHPSNEPAPVSISNTSHQPHNPARPNRPSHAKRKSILKTKTSTPSTTTPALLVQRTATNGSLGASGQHPVEMEVANYLPSGFDPDLVEDMQDESFDLHGAINELGSFLSFDIEREVV